MVGVIDRSEGVAVCVRHGWGPYSVSEICLPSIAGTGPYSKRLICIGSLTGVEKEARGCSSRLDSYHLVTEQVLSRK